MTYCIFFRLFFYLVPFLTMNNCFFDRFPYYLWKI